MVKPTPMYDEGLPAGKELLLVSPATERELLRLLDELTASDDEWGQPLRNLTVYRHGDGFGLCEVHVPQPYCHAEPWIGLPAWAEHAWKDPFVRADLVPLFTAEFYGWLILFEGWGVSYGPDDPPERRQRLEEARRSRTNYLQPDRYEARMCILAGPDGLLTQLSRVRGQNGEEDRVEEIDDARGGIVALARRFADLGARVQYLRQKADTGA